MDLFSLFRWNRRQLAESEAKFRALAEASFGGIAIHVGGRILDCNQELSRMTGYTVDELVGMDGLLLMAPECREMARQRIREAYPYPYEAMGRRKDASLFPLGVHGKSLPYQGQVARVTEFLDLTAQKQAEAALHKVNLQYDTLVTKLPVGVYILRTRQGQAVGFDYVSPPMSQLVGVPVEKMLADYSCVFDVIDPQDRVRLDEVNAERIPRQIPFDWEGRFLHPEGVRWMRITSLPDPQEDGDVLWHGLMVDITEAKEAQDKISALLAEKEVILKEVHHRIKNNMSTISGLLTIQASTLQEPGAVSALEDAKGRVLSMMVLYDKLYLSGGHQSVDLATYLPGLVDQVLGQFPNVASVAWETRAEAVTVDAHVASSLGILVNELLTNTMKYAFVGRQRGMVRVNACQRDHRISVVVHDDGVGLPDGFDPSLSTGFGFTLVTMMAKQLKGTLSVSNEGGARFALEFPGESVSGTGA